MELDDITRTDSEHPATYPPDPKPSPLPWVLLFITVAVFVGTTLFLWRRVVQETDRANQTYVEKTRAETRAKDAESALEGQKQRAVEMAADMKILSDQKTALEEQLKVAEAKVAKPAKAPAKPKVVKKTAVKKKRR